MFYDIITDYKTKHKIKTDVAFEALCGLRGGSCNYYKKGNVPNFKTINKIAKATNTPVKYWVKDV